MISHKSYEAVSRAVMELTLEEKEELFHFVVGYLHRNDGAMEAIEFYLSKFL